MENFKSWLKICNLLVKHFNLKSKNCLDKQMGPEFFFRILFFKNLRDLKKYVLKIPSKIEKILSRGGESQDPVRTFLGYVPAY